MSYRGRLIWPFLCDISSLDTAATAAFPGTGGVVGGYDPDFREPVMVDQGPTLPDVSARQDRIRQHIPCQVHPERGNYNALNQKLSGSDKNFSLRLIFHYIDLECMGLVDSDGRPLLRLNDRLLVIRQQAGSVVRDFCDHQLYATEVQDRSFGLSGLQRNLVMVTFEDREASSLSV